LEKLDAVTKYEYDMLAPYLPQGYESKVKEGEVAIRVHHDKDLLR